MKISIRYPLFLIGLAFFIALISAITGWRPTVSGGMAALIVASVCHILQAIEQLGHRSEENMVSHDTTLHGIGDVDGRSFIVEFSEIETDSDQEESSND